MDLERLLRECRLVDVLENERIIVEVYDCEDKQVRIISKKAGRLLLTPIVLVSSKEPVSSGTGSSS